VGRCIPRKIVMSNTTQTNPTDQPPPLWLQVVVIAIATLIAIVALVISPIAAILTKNPLYLGSSLGGGILLTCIWSRIMKWVFPTRKVDMDFELEKLRIKTDTKSQKRKPPLRSQSQQ